MFGLRKAPVVICHGAHLTGGERIRVHLLRTDGSEEWIEVTISVIGYRADEEDGRGAMEYLVLQEEPGS